MRNEFSPLWIKIMDFILEYVIGMGSLIALLCIGLETGRIINGG